MTSKLADRQCVPCKGGTPPLSEDQYTPLLGELGGGWRVDDGKRLTREYAFDDFVSALGFVNDVGAIAEEQGHHPDVFLAWGKVRLTIWTHAVGGLSESDFVLAAKADRAHGGGHP